MATYVVGDIQGCLSCLEKLLAKVHFNAARDQLRAVGDLVNRGPSSLETLRFCMSLGDRFRTVLGNHDLHLLAVAQGARPPNYKDTLQDILTAPDRHHIFAWLRRQPLLIREGKYCIVHAGIPPNWTLDEAAIHAREVEDALADPAASAAFLNSMYGNEPRCWNDRLEGNDRLRVITNYLTRMRYCDAEGNLELQNKMPPPQGPAGYLPWYAHKQRKTANDDIIFGHWASLNGAAIGPHLYPLDTGCVWGGRLRLMCLETGQYFHQSCASRTPIPSK